MPDILVTEDVAGDGMEWLKGSFQVVIGPELWKDPGRLRRAIADVEAVIVRNQTRVTAELIACASRLKVIGRAGAGLDNIDVQAATAAGVTVVNTPEQNAISVAELTLALMLALARMIPAADRSTKQGRWERQRFTGVELYGKTLGVVGLGRIGFRTARRARAFGMNVLAYDEYVHPDAMVVSELPARLVPLPDLLQQADFVACHLPLTPQTRALFDYNRFGQMKPTAIFINTSRGEVADESGLLRALRERRIAGAALDVRQQEPPSTDPFGQMDNVILTPHIGAFTREGQERVVASVCRDVAAVLKGGVAPNAVNCPKTRR
jgi:D-3-phosphoglycerate dehydrogenase